MNSWQSHSRYAQPYTGIGMVTPVRVLYAQSRGASLAIIGAMASAYLISNFLFQYPSGWVADRWGRKRMLLISLAAQALLSAVYLFISDPLLFIALRFIEGIASALLLPSARALVVDIIPADQQGEAYGIFSSFFSAGFLLGPGIGGLLAATGYASAFIGAVVFRLLAIVLVLLLVHTAKHASTEASAQQSAFSLKGLFTLPLLGTYVLAFGDFLYLGFDQSLMPIWMHDHLGASVALIGLAYVAWSIPTIILSPVGGRIADRARRSTFILIFGLAQVPIYLAYGLVNAALMIVILFAVHGTVYSFVQPAVDAQVAASSSVEMRARVQGTYMMIGMMGAFVGANGFPALYTINFRFPLFAMGIALGLCVLLGGLLVRRSERRAINRISVPLQPEEVTPHRP